MTAKHAEYLKQLEIVLNRLDDNEANKMDIMLGQVIVGAIDIDLENAKKGLINEKRFN